MHAEPSVLTEQRRQWRRQTAPLTKSQRMAFLIRQLIRCLQARCVSDTRTHQHGRLLLRGLGRVQRLLSLHFS